MQLPQAWADFVRPNPAQFAALSQRVEAVYAAGEVFPPRDCLFAALEATPPEAVRCVIPRAGPLSHARTCPRAEFLRAPGRSPAPEPP